MKALLELFLEFFRLSLFVIGGGYSILIVADRRLSGRGWIREGELVEMLPVFQMLPGIIAVHTAVYVGRKRAGAAGAATAVLAVTLPSIVIFAAVAAGYRSIPVNTPLLAAAFSGLRAALAGIIAATVVRCWTQQLKGGLAYAIMALSLLALTLGRLPIALVLVLAALSGLGASAWRPGRHCSFAWLPLFLFLQYGALCFGGGFVIVPMYLRDFVGPAAPFLQLSAEEFSNVMALSQMTPGPIGINCATFFGFRLAGVAGAVLASVLLVLPGALAGFAVFGSLERFGSSRLVAGLMRGLKPAALALMLVALYEFALGAAFDAAGGFQLVPALLVLIVAALVYFKRGDVILLVVASAVVAMAAALCG